ncbi:MAG: phosphatase PAP2 family protein [Candidatus Eisenbacteria bacterium]
MTAASAPVSRRYLGFALAVAAVFLGCLALEARVDMPVAEWARGLDGSWLHRVASLLTILGDAAVYLVPSALAALLLRRSARFRPHAAQATLLFLCVVISGLSADVLKVLFGRPRPTLLFSGGLSGFHGFHFGHDWNSFPSGHATTVGALVVVFVAWFPRARVPILLAAILVASTRVILHEHFVSDVVMGFAWGVASALVVRDLASDRIAGLAPSP